MHYYNLLYIIHYTLETKWKKALNDRDQLDNSGGKS